MSNFAGKFSNNGYLQPHFSHIYVEKAVRDHPRTQAILAKLPGARVVEITHYKDVFCRSKQNYLLQHQAQNLILAARQGTLLYPGAPVCQSFGESHFYYTSCMMNCLYDCEYCYLKGMYPSANLVLFINLEDYFAQIGRLLGQHPVYVCVSYDTDLLAFEPLAGYVAAWEQFVKTQKGLQIEIRTKSAMQQFWEHQKAVPGVIYAFTLSPQEVIKRYEHDTPSLQARLFCVRKAVRAGCQVRLCFDPMIYFPGWQQHYEEMADQVFGVVDHAGIMDVSVGSFRISKNYLKKMRKQEPASAIVQFPYQLEDGFYQYPNELMVQMEQYLVSRLHKYVAKEKIFLWKTS